MDESNKTGQDRDSSPPPIPDHELLQRIGRGSYGEVWLARTTLAVLRAVKIVRRSDFENDLPYEREFTGLKHFEPVSREHEGFVDILQLGRNDSEGFFYYVMEAADDAMGAHGKKRGSEAESATASSASDSPQEPRSSGHKSAPSEAGGSQSRLTSAATVQEGKAGDYRPLTLETRARQEGRLPARECVRIAVTLAEALRHLHEKGLVHRDIKPSNIIFVGGVPKLADVGLVAQTASARSFVGTEGFVPPEGPGTPRADIYSLGKVLYEIAMGRDRLAFPSPPTQLAELPDRQQLLELNEIILRACDPDPDRRYRDAGELLAELELLHSGRSLIHARRNRRVIRYATGVAALLALCMFLPAIWNRILAPAEPAAPEPSLKLVRDFNIPGDWPAGDVQFGDRDGDGDVELFAANPDGQMIWLDRQGTELLRGRNLNLRGERCDLALLADLDGDGHADPVVAWNDSTNLFLSVFDQRLRETRRYNAAGTYFERGGALKLETWFSVLAFRPPTATEPPQLLTYLGSGFTLWPRELRCYSATNETLLWSAKVAAPPGKAISCDLDGDGREEWLISAFAPGNGATLPAGENDSQSYLRAFTHDGKPLWRMKTGDGTDCIPFACAINGTNAIYALVVTRSEVSTQTSKPLMGCVLQADANGHEIARYDAGTDLYSLISCDLDGDKSSELLATDGQGNLHVLDPSLHLKRKVPISPRTHDWVELLLQPPADLDGDGKPELVFRCMQVEFKSGRNPGDMDGPMNVRLYHDVSLIVFDTELRRVAFYELATETKRPAITVVVCPPAKDGSRELAILGRSVQFLRFHPPR